MAVSLDFSTLPAEFLTEEDISSLMLHKHHFKPPSFNSSTHSPYEFDSFGYNSALNSPDSESGSCDEGDFLAGLTRRLAQQLGPRKSEERAMAASHEATLSGIGSWSMKSRGSPNGVLSPPTTPFGAENDTLDLMYAAASEVARLNLRNGLKNGGSNEKSGCLQGSRGLLGTNNAGPTRKQDVGGFEVSKISNGFYPVRSFSRGYPQLNQVPLKQPDGAVLGRQQLVTAEQQTLRSWQRQHQKDGKANIWSDHGRCVRPAGLPPGAWSHLQVQANQHHRLQVQLNQRKQQLLQHHCLRQLANCGSRAPAFDGPVKRVCTGTGVFLPRRYSNPRESKNESACARVLIPEKVQPPNSNFESLDINCRPHPRFSSAAFDSDYNAVMGNVNASYAQQRRSSHSHSDSGLNYEIKLPQEWTY